MTRPEGIQRALPRVEEGSHPTFLAEGVHLLPATGEELVGVGLVADVEHQIILGGVEGAVEGDDQFHRAERGAEVAPHPPADGDDLRPQLGAQLGEQFLGEAAHVPGRLDAPEEAHLARSTLYRASAASGPGTGSRGRTAASASATRPPARAREASSPSTAG